MKRAVIDCETLGIGACPAIAQIGIVILDGAARVANLQLNVKVMGTAGFTPSTVAWWLEQSEAARMRMVDAMKNGMPLSQALAVIKHNIDQHGVWEVWVNGAGEDGVWLREAAKSIGVPEPFDFRQVRCYRTLRALFGQHVEAPPETGVAHVALDDAEYQAEYLIRLLEHAGVPL